MTTLMLVGAIGLVGGAVLRQAQGDVRVTRIVAPTRRQLPPHPKLENPLVDFEHLPADAPWWAVDGVVCTLGTTIRKAGSQEAFRRVDHDYPLAVARLARQHGARAFALNSATGADPHSRFFYNRVKGEVEEALRGVGFPSLSIVRPAMIGGDRDEFRPAEFVGHRQLNGSKRVRPSEIVRSETSGPTSHLGPAPEGLSSRLAIISSNGVCRSAEKVCNLIMN
jgi:uncharacterized protein YbjT (DUF2867 family)